MSQNDDILKYMLDHGSITPREAYAEFGCLALHSLISDLRNKYGIRIDDKYESAKNRRGDMRRCKRYWVVIDR